MGFTPPVAPTLTQILTAQGLNVPASADYTTFLHNAADFAYAAPDGLGIAKLFSSDSISGRYTTAGVFGSGKTVVAKIRGSADSFAGPGLLLRDPVLGVYQTITCRVSGQTWRSYQFSAADNFVAEPAAAVNMIQRDVGTGWWFKAADDTVNITYYVSYDASPNGEPSAWRTLWTIPRRNYNGSNTGLGVTGWTQVGISAYGFAIGGAGTAGVLESLRVF